MWRRVFAGIGVVAAACSVPVATNLDESDANQAVLLLDRSGVGADKERDPEHENRFRVSVTSADSSTAIGLLAQENLPPKASPGVLEALGSGSVVPSRLSEQARWTSGTSGDLERSLRTLEGVLSARVHLALPQRDALLAEEAPPGHASASVLIRHRGKEPPLPATEVQRLVAGAVPGLAAEHVTVVLTPSPQQRSKEPELSRFGPLTLTHGSLATLKAAVACALLFNAGLVALLIWIWLRLRRTEQNLADARPIALQASQSSQ